MNVQSSSRLPFGYAVSITLCLMFVQAHVALAGKPQGTLSNFAVERTWSDTTGKFRVVGKLEYADEKEVHLRANTGKLLRIPLEKLSEADNIFAKTFLQAETALGGAAADNEQNPFQMVDGNGASTPEAASSTDSDSPFRTTNSGKNSVGAAAGGANSAGKIPVKQVLKRASRPIPLSFDAAFWKSTPPLALRLSEIPDLTITTDVAKTFFAAYQVKVAGKSPIALINVYQQGRDANYSTYTAVTLANGETTPETRFDDPLRVLAISPDGKRAVAVRVVGFDKGSDLVLLKIDGSGVQAEYEFRAGGGSWDEVRWASFLPNNRLATISEKNIVSIWELSNPKGVVLYSQGNLGAKLPVVTSVGTDKLAIASKESLAIIDTAELKQSGCIVCDKPILATCFADDGSKIIIQMAYELGVYSTTDGTLTKSIPIANPNAANLHCMGKFVLVDDLLLDAEQGVPVWTYVNASKAATLSNLVLNSFPDDKSTTLTASILPHRRALDASANFSTQDIYAIKPGTPVRVSVVVKGNTSIQKQIDDAIRSNILKAGWKISDDADILVTASLEQGEQSKEDYVTSQGRFGLPPPSFFRNASGPVEQVTFTPWTHKVEITRGDEVIFTNVRYVGAPQSFQSKDGESTQASVTRLVQPQIGYFESLNLPPYLWKAEFRGGFGSSTIEASGLR